jgi:DNA-binding SARP family transcriptional activator
VSAAALVDEVWPNDPPAGARNALQSLVSRARRSLGDPAAISQGPAGCYLLNVSLQDVDAQRFEALAVQGRRQLQSGDAVDAVATLRRALSLWRGHFLGEADTAPAAAAAGARWEELRECERHGSSVSRPADRSLTDR